MKIISTVELPVTGDEIKSTVSDTWSTDVLASDSEPPEQNTLERLDEVEEIMGRHNLLGVNEVRTARPVLYEGDGSWLVNTFVLQNFEKYSG